jgi:Flp pilus assembly pilin Flp
MNETLAQIKSLMKSGDFAGAEALCRKALEENPEDVALRFLLATCRRLLGDEETFRDIMLEIAPKMEAVGRDDPDSDAAKLWRKSGAVLMEYVVLGVLVVAAVVAGVLLFGGDIKHQFLYAGPQMYRTLYGPAISTRFEINPAGTNIVESATTNSVAPANGPIEQPSQTESETP